MDMIEMLRGQRNAAMDALADCNVQLHQAHAELARVRAALAQTQAKAPADTETASAETTLVAVLGERDFEIG